LKNSTFPVKVLKNEHEAIPFVYDVEILDVSLSDFKVGDLSMFK